MIAACTAMAPLPLSHCRPGASMTAALNSRSKLRVAVVARAGDRNGGNRVDWDREWSSYVNDRSQQEGNGGTTDSRRSNVYTTTSGSNGSSRRQRVPVDPAAKMMRDAIKREEAFMLNAWTSDRFQGAGVAIAVIVLLVLLLAAGPPPADSRCTLPWC